VLAGRLSLTENPDLGKAAKALFMRILLRDEQLFGGKVLTR
jgi:hypothetical protein